MAHKTSLFLASSSELKVERGAFEARIGRKNKLWHESGIFLHLDVWEDCVDAMSRTRLQDEYNVAIRAADIFVLLVHTKVGKYSAEEFETAHACFMATGKPLIYTYFKNSPGHGAQDPRGYASVRALQAQLATLGHFITPYESVAELLDHFTQQLDKLQANGVIQADVAPSSDADALMPNYEGAMGRKNNMTQAVGTQSVGSGGIAIGGSNAAPITVGAQTHFNTGGGAYVAGGVYVSGGDFVGRDQVERTNELSGLNAVFAALLASTMREAGPTANPLAVEHVAAIASEAEQLSTPAKDARLARLIDGLADLVPGAASALVDTFASPLLAGVAGPATTAVLGRLKEMRSPTGA